MIRISTTSVIALLAVAIPAIAYLSGVAASAPRAAAAPFTFGFGDRFAGKRTVVAAAQSQPQAEPEPEAAPEPKPLAEPIAPAPRPMLKADVTVVDDIVRIGDMIDNAGAVADVAIFRAPDLGQTGAVPVNRVIEAVRSHQLARLDTHGIAEVLVTRQSRAITKVDIEARIVRALAGQSGLAEAKFLSVMFDNDVRTLQVEAAANADLRVLRLTFEPRSGRFDVTFELPGSAVARRWSLRYTGAIAETFEAVVPARAIAQGEVLTASDLTVTRRPKNEFVTGVTLDPEKIVGLAAKRALRQGQVVRQSDVAKPELIARNETVSISYEVPGIVVTIRGQALESGAAGDVINVLNVQSKKTLQATVTGPGRVNVGGTLPRQVNASLPAPITR